MIAIALIASMLAGGDGQDTPAGAGAARPPIAYKILTRSERHTLDASGRFEGSAKDLEDGFVHLSTESQLTRTADLHFAGNDDLFVAAVDLRAAGEQLKWELSPRSGLLFPHLYAALDKALVTGIAPLRRDDGGRVVLPAQLKAPAAAASPSDGRDPG
ncbi:DUF952 domain-containing protein [Lysobacter enzymogenes]|uniref:DUF952 domain-containing protein n=1 Tax=Lysobacter enzymogenes TaxID=69 RepID=UPI001AF9F4E7|nr:DUF952 domain-containing protein [Lysobacter enzymogenes]QQQ01298.1 DUF952 domain-containing protein [Lysobacter enzymogenes]